MVGGTSVLPFFLSEDDRDPETPVFNRQTYYIADKNVGISGTVSKKKFDFFYKTIWIIIIFSYLYIVIKIYKS